MQLLIIPTSSDESEKASLDFDNILDQFVASDQTDK